MQRKPDVEPPPATEPPRKRYASPKLIRYGAVNALTRSGVSTKNEGSPVLRRVGSDRRLKENVVRVGTHPLGPGLYLFDYKPEFRDAHGHGRQFGVMADEIAAVMPGAISRDAEGYLGVDYGALGIAADPIE
jgi:hypothetical protein